LNGWVAARNLTPNCMDLLQHQKCGVGLFCAGYAFILFRDEVSVHRLVKTCLSEEGKLYMFVSSVTQTNKKV